MESEIKKNRKQNPSERANFVSALLFLYMFSLFRKNYKYGFQEKDLFEPLEEHKSTLLGDRLENIWKTEHRKHKKMSLHIALLRMFGFKSAIIGVLLLINQVVLVLVMPNAVRGLVSYFQHQNSENTKSEAYLNASLIILSLLLNVFISNQSDLALIHIAMKMRVACCSLIYRKSLRLSHVALAQTTIGQIVNLLSNDVSKFDYGFHLCHYVWIAPVQTAIAVYLLYRVIGVSALAGIFFLLSFIPLQVYIGKKISQFRLRTALRTDERVRLMNEILNGIQVIKMYTWEKPFAKLVDFVRKHEVKSIRARFFLQAIMYSFEMFVTRTSIFISIIVFISLGNILQADTAYSLTAIYSVVQPMITFTFSVSVSSIAEMYTSIRRLQTFLRYEELPCVKYHSNEKLEHKEDYHLLSRLEKEYVKKGNINISLNNVTAKWRKDMVENTLSNINLIINRSGLVAVIGPVGSGKSSLLNVMLKELPLSSGSMEISGRISYASQESWLFPSSVRQNIIFGNVYDDVRYKKVLKICALEEDLAVLPYGDRTIVGEKGKSLSGGQKARISLARCIYTPADIYLLDDPLSAVDTKVGKQLYDDCINHFLSDKICILVTHQLQYLKSADKIIILQEGKIIEAGNFDELQTSGLHFAQLLHKFHTGDEVEENKNLIKSIQSSEVANNDNSDEDSPKIIKESVKSGHIKASVYKAYFRAGGSYMAMFMVFLAFVATKIVVFGGDYFVSYWTNLEQRMQEIKQNNTNNGYNTINRNLITYIYSAIIAATIVMAIGHSILYFIFLMKASVNLHNKIFEKISYATMHFFNTNPTGRILNRFAKDVGIIDEYIPGILSDVLQISLWICATLVLTSIVNPWLTLPSSCLLLLFYLLRLVYVETSRSVKRVEATTRSPIFSHMATSMHGLSTIRALSTEKTLINEFDAHQDLHSSAWYLFIVSNKAFALWLDFFCAILITVITISFLVNDRGYYGGDVGLIITQYLSLMGIIQWGIRQWSELENQMTSVERVLEYTTVDTEPIRKEIIEVAGSWPEYGKITFQDVSMRYSLDDVLVLKNMNFTIQPCEKIGIVGRTGAGKTSIIAALFQLYNINGSIAIDDVDTTKLPLEKLRSKISIIPQEPVLFSGTLRKTLDPFEEYKDEVMWNALEQVELKDIIAEIPDGLSAAISENGSNFSIGQRQLICLARAILRNNKILVMDEATANVDPHTDALIQKTIRKEFSSCTVITIAHRLQTIMDSDRVLVIDAGRVVDFDHPYVLLQHTNSIFYSLVQTTGKAASKSLYTIAEESFNKMKNN